jgi:hypothetical protein
VASHTAQRARAFAASALLAIVLCVGAVSPAGAALPDGRGYELVSPAVKAGADVIGQSYKTFSAADGNGVAFVATGAFGEVRGTSIDVQYLARRHGAAGTSGWSARAIDPLGGAPTFLALVNSNIPTFEAAFTPDLSAGVYKAWRPVTDAPNVAGISNLYRLRGLDADRPQVDLVSDSAVALGAAPGFARLFFQNNFNGASRDLRHVIFQSPWNLTGDGSFSSDGDLYEYADGVGVRRVGRIPSTPDVSCDDINGPPCIDVAGVRAGISAPVFIAQSQYSSTMVAEDGSRIVFSAPSGGLYMREDGVRTFQLDASQKSAPESPGSAEAWEMARDGSRVFFTTSEGLIDGDDDGKSDLYMYDRTAAEGERLTRISANATGETCFAIGVVAVSSDGRYVYFLCTGQLVPGEPSSTVGLFLWHDGALAYVGRFDNFSDAVPNTPRTGWQFASESRASRVTPDGRFLLFMAKRDEGFRGRGGFAGYDHGSTCFYGGGSGTCRQLYLFSADSGRLVCASCNPRSGVATGDALTDVYVGLSGSAITQHVSHALSDDGRRVFFTSREALVVEDVNGKSDAYMYDVASGTVHLISSGTDPADSYFLDASPDGHDVFFATREQLVGWDIDKNYDLYDARVGGGFPEPVPPAQPCAGETCRAPSTGVPTLERSVSAQFRGAGNAVERLRKHRRCKRKAVLRRVRGKRKCVQRRGVRKQRARARERSGR